MFDKLETVENRYEEIFRNIEEVQRPHLHWGHSAVWCNYVKSVFKDRQDG